MSVRARMQCHAIKINEFGGATVYLHPIYSDDPNSPNYSYSKATPSGEVYLNITSPDAANFFIDNGIYDLTFEPWSDDHEAA